MDAPHEQSFDSYGGYRAALFDALEHAQQTVILFDPDLRECGLESRAGIAHLERLCSRATRRDALRILLHSAAWLEKECPRLTRLLGHYAHCASVRTTNASARTWSQPFLLADDNLLVTRFHQDLPRGKAITDGSGAHAHLALQFEASWLTADTSTIGTPLGI
ncbi:hypothetical protein GPA22_15920 [Aromatoleum toluvorans]|uniref:DUF7931 domain-containing protein n=1 Tax=Aromatoleum toluvorans TaxID=92002 RepID=A0ABX1Q376_9RHOO|nr:hypothetical protein [Aromatoleum toluvorans]NMG45206.1 hypothetical protein [Aromatoleum toluvorans]